MKTLPVLIAILLATPASASDAPLTRIVDILRMPLEEVKKKIPVRLRATVTYYRFATNPDLVVQDETGGIFVNGAGDAVSKTLRPGMDVEIDGLAVEGNFTPRVNLSSVRIVGPGTLPAPIHFTFDELLSGRYDCRFVETTGIVRTATINEQVIPRRLLLRIASPTGAFDAWVLHFGSSDGQELVDAAVSVRGVILAWDNPRRQLSSIRMLVDDLKDVVVTRAPPADPFASPLTTPDALMRFHPDGFTWHRARLRGVVTWVGHGDQFVMQEGKFGVIVRGASIASLKLGDDVEAAGFPGLIGNTAGLQDAIFRVVGRKELPEPVELSADMMLKRQKYADTDKKLVRLRGRLRAVDRDSTDVHFYLEDGDVTFVASLARGEESSALERLEPGVLLELTGICDTRPSAWARRFGKGPDGFGLLLRAPSDIVVIEAGPWLTVPRLLLALGVGGGALLLALLWALTLRRRVAKRTAQLAREIRLQHDTEIEFNAKLAERNRVAGELHDTLQQSITAAVLQLNAAELAARHDASKVGGHVEVAKHVLDKTREDLRRVVWGLFQNAGGEPRDLIGELTEMAQSMTLGAELRVDVKTSGDPRPLSELLAHHAFRIAQEAVTNAIRHGGAKSVTLEIAFGERALALRIRDDGKGFEAGAARGPAAGHFGLHGMRERARRLGGTLSIESAPGQGTTVALDAPFEAMDAETRRRGDAETI